MRMHLSLAAGLILMAGACKAPAEHVTVADRAALLQALAAARPGDSILLAPGTYQGGLHVQALQGAEGSPIVLAAADPADPPLIAGGGTCLQLSDPAWVQLHDLVFTGATGNGLNIDDGGSFDTPAHHIVLRRLTVREIGPEGNCDGIKLSGVDDFRVEQCVLENWGSGGSAIDMVGCHRGLISGCSFHHDTGASTGVQAKGGSSQVVVRGNTFREAGARGVNIGGSTGLQYFRPAPQGYEAREITVEGNLFIGGQAPVAFVGVDGSVVRFNTIYLPGRWALRILQETREPGFVPCRKGVFTDNIVVFRSDQWAEGGVNIGPATEPATFSFARNVWYCLDRPSLGPTLPAPETEGLVGQDPMFADPQAGDFGLQAGSPAAGRGHTALPEAEEGQ
ncbi:MAG: right-handed parallel beta-helix repeat-containing protein [Armatimonadota bacterium]